LSACGGGSGGYGGGGGDPGGSGPMAITADNAPAAARAGLAAVDAGQIAGTAGDGLVGPLGGAGLVASQARAAHAVAARAMALGHRQAAAVQTSPCGAGGTITLTLTDTNGNAQLDRAGEAVSLAVNQCDFGDGVKLNGSFVLTLTGYTDTQHYAFNLSFNNFTANDLTSNVQFAVNGNLAVTKAGLSGSISSPSYSVSATDHGTAHSFSVKSFSATVTEDSGQTQTTESVAGTFSGTDFGTRYVTLSTLVPIVILSSDTYPSQGSLLIQGSGGSALKVEALNAAQARLSVDANGDGSYETVTTVNWADIG